ncbi:MAG TPA: YeeE/YedE family protein [Ramlibacter sp.]|nr:YeeE/YedE family protein [Ramlibacter sp.]
MSSDADLAHLGRLVVWGGLGLGLLLGIFGQATRFCVRGAIADWFAYRSPARLVSWLLAVAVGAVAVQAMISLGLFDASRTLGWSQRLLWASCLAGGLVFGFGMMLSGGCPQRCLVKAGAGSLKAAITLVILAIASLMTLRGLFAGPRVALLDSWGVALGRPQDLGSLLGGLAGLPPGLLRWAFTLALVLVVAALAWRLRTVLEKAHWIGGIAVGLLLAAAFYLSGHIGFVPEHPQTLEPAWLGTQSKRPEGLSFAAPLGHALDLLTLWSDTATVATFGVTLAVGVLLGSFASAKVRGEFRVETFSTPRELREHVAGALLMGFGGVTALGCSIGNGVTGLALLSAGSVLAVAGIVLGAWLALKWQMREGDVGKAKLAAAS